jgi:capsular polysaccharide biosynthesis protein
MDIVEVLVALRRRWWLLAAFPAAVVLVSVLIGRPRPATYEARLRFAVDIPRSAVVEGSDEGTAAKVGEALIDDIARILPSEAFARAVALRLPDDGRVSAGELASDLSATDRHRIADVWVRRSAPRGASPEQLEQLEKDLLAVASAAVDELEQNGSQWFARLGEDDVALTVIDGPDVSAVGPSLRERLDLPLRATLALILATGVACLWHYLDPILRTEGEARAAAGANLLGRIPRSSRTARLR